ncbi:MAG TPA: ROK family protein [Rhodothermia bacterium]
MTSVTTCLGIDIGGSGIKGAIVDCESGALLSDRYRLETPSPATPVRIGRALRQMIRELNWDGPVGCTFPAVIDRGVALTAANVHKSCRRADLRKAFSDATGCRFTLLNDADAAGVGESRFGVAKGRTGLVVLLTFGTGIGSAMISDGRLVANTEFGHLYTEHGLAEHFVSNKARKEEKLPWREFARRVSAYLRYLSQAFNPDLFIIGGGVSDPGRAPLWMPHLKVPTPVECATLANNAGLIGAAYVALSGLECEGRVRPF